MFKYSSKLVYDKGWSTLEKEIMSEKDPWQMVHATCKC